MARMYERAPSGAPIILNVMSVPVATTFVSETLVFMVMSYGNAISLSLSTETLVPGTKKTSEVVPARYVSLYTLPLSDHTAIETAALKVDAMLPYVIVTVFSVSVEERVVVPASKTPRPRPSASTTAYANATSLLEDASVNRHASALSQLALIKTTSTEAFALEVSLAKYTDK